MSNNPIEILKWPELIGHIPSRLERTTQQDFQETRMDSGDVKSRPTSSPYPVFKGIVSLSNDEWRILEVFALQCGRSRSHFSFKDESGGTVYAAFKELPEVKRSRPAGTTKYSVVIETTLDVEIVLLDATDRMNRARESGVIFKD